jgi:hypothetical protein
MIKVDINKTSILGLLIGVAAITMAVFDSKLGSPTVGSVLGPDAPFARVGLWMIFALVAVVVYLVGRLIWLFREGLR